MRDDLLLLFPLPVASDVEDNPTYNSLTIIHLKSTVVVRPPMSKTRETSTGFDIELVEHRLRLPTGLELLRHQCPQCRRLRI